MQWLAGALLVVANLVQGDSNTTAPVQLIIGNDH